MTYSYNDRAVILYAYNNVTSTVMSAWSLEVFKLERQAKNKLYNIHCNRSRGESLEMETE